MKKTIFFFRKHINVSDCSQSNFAPNTQSQVQANLMSKTVKYDMEIYEPRRDKTNKVTVRSAKTQISLGICPDWSESSLWA